MKQFSGGILVGKHKSEILLVAAGLALILSLPIIAFTEDFSLWIVSKIFYGFGVMLFLLNK